MNDPHLADDFLAEEFDEFRGLRMTAVHERFHEKDVVPSRCLDDRQRFGVIECQRFFAEDVLAGFGGLEAPLGVRGVRCCDVDRLNLGIGTMTWPSYDYGTTYLWVCGLLNYLIILDAFDIAQGRKP